MQSREPAFRVVTEEVSVTFWSIQTNMRMCTIKNNYCVCMYSYLVFLLRVSAPSEHPEYRSDLAECSYLLFFCSSKLNLGGHKISDDQ
jgi:hypothetical protein